MSFVNHWPTAQAQRQIGQAEIAAVGDIEPASSYDREALQCKKDSSPRGSGRRSGQPPESEVGVWGEPIERQALPVRSLVTPTNHELYFNAGAGQSMAGLDGLDSVGPFHWKADVG